MEPQSLRKHITQTYINLRVGMGLMGLAFPLLLLLGGLLVDDKLENSLSAYYYTPMRDVFVGVLISIGSFLYLYKGFTRLENYALNLAGIFAVGIALLPTSVPGAVEPKTLVAQAHDVCGVLFFLSVAYVCLFRMNDTLRLIEDAAVANRYRRWYRVIGILMVILPAVAAFLTLRLQSSIVILVVECVAVWMFSAYWLVKSRELSLQTGCVELTLISEI